RNRHHPEDVARIELSSQLAARQAPEGQNAARIAGEQRPTALDELQERVGGAAAELAFCLSARRIPQRDGLARRGEELAVRRKGGGVVAPFAKSCHLLPLFGVPQTGWNGGGGEEFAVRGKR